MKINFRSASVPGHGRSFGLYLHLVRRGLLFGLGWNPAFQCVNLIRYHAPSMKLRVFSI